jgi:hypothetical protein
MYATTDEQAAWFLGGHAVIAIIMAVVGAFCVFVGSVILNALSSIMSILIPIAIIVGAIIFWWKYVFPRVDEFLIRGAVVPNAKLNGKSPHISVEDREWWYKATHIIAGIAVGVGMIILLSYSSNLVEALGVLMFLWVGVSLYLTWKLWGYVAKQYGAYLWETQNLPEELYYYHAPVEPTEEAVPDEVVE